MADPVRGDRQRLGQRRQLVGGEPRPGRIQMIGGRMVLEEAREPVRQVVGPGQHGQYAGSRDGVGRVDIEDPGMRVRRAEKRRVRLAGRGDVVAEAAPAGKQPAILLPGYPFADRPACHSVSSGARSQAATVSSGTTSRSCGATSSMNNRIGSFAVRARRPVLAGNDQERAEPAAFVVEPPDLFGHRVGFAQEVELRFDERLDAALVVGDAEAVELFQHLEEPPLGLEADFVGHGGTQILDRLPLAVRDIDDPRRGDVPARVGHAGRVRRRGVEVGLGLEPAGRFQEGRDQRIAAFAGDTDHRLGIGRRRHRHLPAREWAWAAQPRPFPASARRPSRTARRSPSISGRSRALR